MKQYVDKSALVKEIEKAIDETAPSHDQQCQYEDGYYCGLYKAESIIDTLEVKEVDLEKEIDIWYDKFATNNKFDWNGFAQHFFELGLKMQKGE